MPELLLNWLIVLGATFGFVVVLLIVMSLIVWENVLRIGGFWIVFRLYLVIVFVVALHFHDKLFVWL